MLGRGLQISFSINLSVKTDLERLSLYHTKTLAVQLRHPQMKLPVNYNGLNYKDKRVAREAYIEQQKGKCYYCGNSLSGEASEVVLKKPVNEKLFPKGFFEWPIHLHHDHETGMTIGAIHSYCNAVLWQYHGE